MPASSKLMATILIVVGLGATLSVGREPQHRLAFFFRLWPRAGSSSRPGALHVPSSTWQQPSIAELAGVRSPRGLRGGS